MKLVTAAQMREMDRRTIEDYGVPGMVLMENAALRVVEVIAERFGPLPGKRIAVLCGGGNNGGDGFAIARHLAGRFGAETAIWLFADPARITGDAAKNLKMAQSFGLDIRISPDPIPDLQTADLIVDALLGTGIRGAVRDTTAVVIEAINAAGKPVAAVDIPSGLQSDTGQADGPCVRATVTVTFALTKYGLVEYPGADYAGELIVADIGMPSAVKRAESVNIEATEASDVARWLPVRVNFRDSNKGRYGHVTLVAGSRGYLGAAMMAAESAARTGAGLVTLAVPLSAQSIAVSHISPAIMTRGISETAAGTFSSSALEAALKLAGHGTAAGIGPGLGGRDDPDTRAFAVRFIRDYDGPLVVDADGLTALAQEPDGGAEVVKARKAATVLTPHPGEMGLLMGIPTAGVQAGRRETVERAARKYGCSVLLKGVRTLIASPDGRLNVNTTGNPGMATGGSGDVLTGVIAALLAQGLGAHEAASAGAYLHGLAGNLAAARNGGPIGMIATDLIGLLPQAIAHCQGIL